MSEYKKFGISMEEKVLLAIDSAMPKIDVRTRSEFITEAVLYFLSALNTEDVSKVLTPAVESSIRAATRESENHVSRMLFKMSVELDMLMHVVAATNDIDQSTLSQLRGMCVQEVKSSIGTVNFDDAVRTQKG